MNKTAISSHFWVSLSIAMCECIMVFFLFHFHERSAPSPSLAANNIPSIAFPDNAAFGEIRAAFQKAAEEKGGAYAFGVLRGAVLPSGTDVHLLAHAIGDMLYAKEGVEGIKICTNDFRNACSHSIVIGELLKNGEGALGLIAETCRQAPGGSGAYTMCFHGLGHGILAYTGYVLEKALGMCEKTGTEALQNREYVECSGGAVMEMMEGVHDREVWQEQFKKYTRANDPLYPCTGEVIPEGAKFMCYYYITPQLFKRAGGDLQNLRDEIFGKALAFCNKIPEERPSDREGCFGGFGKDFVVIAQSRDIRKVSMSGENELRKIQGWCELAPTTDGAAACLVHATNALFWGGENPVEPAILFCRLFEDSNLKNICFDNLTGNVNFYIKDMSYRATFCKKIDPGLQEGCRRYLGL